MDGSSLVFEQCARVLPQTQPQALGGHGHGFALKHPVLHLGPGSHQEWVPSLGQCLTLILKESWDIPQRKQHRVSLFAGCFPAGGISPVGATKQILIQLYFSCHALLLSLRLQSCLQALQVAVKMDLLVLRLSVRSQLRATLKARARSARWFFKR